MTMTPDIIAEGSKEVVNFYLQEDSTGNDRVDQAIDLTGNTAIEVHLRKFSDQSEVVYSSLDVSTKVVVLDLDGTVTTINNVPASHLQLTLVDGDVSAVDEGFDVYLVIKDGSGVPFRVPNKEYKQLLILSKFS